MALTSPLTRICDLCHHRLITVVLDNGKQVELDTQHQCYVITGREQGDMPIYVPSRSYVLHADVCKGNDIDAVKRQNLQFHGIEYTQ